MARSWGSIIENGRAERFITRLCELIKRLAVDKLHIVGDLFDRGPRPDIILDLLLRHHSVDIQWGNHDVVWMGAAAGSPICCATVLKTTLAYHNHGMIEDSYGINLRHLQRMADQYYGRDDLTIWMPHTDAARGPYTEGMLYRCAVMHRGHFHHPVQSWSARSSTATPDFQMQGAGLPAPDPLGQGDGGHRRPGVPAAGHQFPHGGPCRPRRPERGRADGGGAAGGLLPAERPAPAARPVPLRQGQRPTTSENGNLLYHGAVPMTAGGRLCRRAV